MSQECLPAGGCFGYVPRRRSSRHDGWDPSTPLSCHHTWRDTLTPKKPVSALRQKWINEHLRPWKELNQFWKLVSTLQFLKNHNPSIPSIVSFLWAISLLLRCPLEIWPKARGEVDEPSTQSWCIRLSLSFCFRFLVSHLWRKVRVFPPHLNYSGGKESFSVI